MLDGPASGFWERGDSEVREGRASSRPPFLRKAFLVSGQLPDTESGVRLLIVRKMAQSHRFGKPPGSAEASAEREQERDNGSPDHDAIDCEGLVRSENRRDDEPVLEVAFVCHDAFLWVVCL